MIDFKKNSNSIDNEESNPRMRSNSLDTDEITVHDPTRKSSDQKKDLAGGGLSVILTIIQGSDIDFGRIYNLSETTIRIGRDSSNTIQLNDRKISKNHCEISTVKTNQLEQIVLKDLSSTNGTYVNGEQVQQRILHPGDKIALGETVLRFSYNDEIEEEYHAKLFNFAATDALTGLYNRRYIFNELENHLKIAHRNERTLSVAVLDIDDFKNINDTYGHPAGDEFLKKVAFIINHSLREQDIPGRIGGEEFMIVLPETNQSGAFNMANRIRLQIEASEINFEGNIIRATISAGVSQCSRKTRTAQSLFQSADQALYEAKNSGKNKVIRSPLGKSAELTNNDTHER